MNRINKEKVMKRFTGFLTVTALLSSTALASAETLTWARAGDALTLDPH